MSPRIGGVEYGETAFAFMRELYLKVRGAGLAEQKELKHQAYVLHTFHEEFPGLVMVGDVPTVPGNVPEQQELSDPDANRIGKFQRPGDAAETQRLAALQVYPRSGTARRRVLDLIGSKGERGATDEEVQTTLNMNPSTQRPRRVELVEGGWVIDSGLYRKTDSGSLAVVWVLSERGKSRWKEPR